MPSEEQSYRNEDPRTGFSPYLSLDQSEAKNRFSPEPRTGRTGGKKSGIFSGTSVAVGCPQPLSKSSIAGRRRRLHSPSPLTVAARRSQVRSMIGDRRAATVSGDGDGGRRLSFWSEVGDGRRRLKSRRKSQISFLLFFQFLVQEKICSSLRFDRD